MEACDWLAVVFMGSLVACAIATVWLQVLVLRRVIRAVNSLEGTGEFDDRYPAELP